MEDTAAYRVVIESIAAQASIAGSTAISAEIERVNPRATVMESVSLRLVTTVDRCTARARCLGAPIHAVTTPIRARLLLVLGAGGSLLCRQVIARAGSAGARAIALVFRLSLLKRMHLF